MEGDQFGFQGGAMCKATLDFVEHHSLSLICQPTSEDIKLYIIIIIEGYL